MADANFVKVIQGINSANVMFMCYIIARLCIKSHEHPHCPEGEYQIFVKLSFYLDVTVHHTFMLLFMKMIVLQIFQFLMLSESNALPVMVPCHIIYFVPPSRE
jgi:hypothetical protein